MDLMIGILIELIVIAVFLYLTRRISNVFFRTIGVGMFAFIVANTIYWLPVWIGVYNGKHVSNPHTFILFWTTFGITIGGLVFWVTQSKKHMKNRN
jgi:hypothetical protein